MKAATAGHFIVLAVTVDLALSAIFNDTFITNNLLDTRRAVKKHISTSSSSGSTKDSNDSDDGNSLEITSDSSEESDEYGQATHTNPEKNTFPKSSEERRGWRKWHRKCTPCPEMILKWRDPSIKWICGAYQRARRSFKSLCMMHYRNCQDGTMFVKLHDHRCKNDSERDGWRAGDHFFYEYQVNIRDDSSKSISTSSQESEPISTD